VPPLRQDTWWRTALLPGDGERLGGRPIDEQDEGESARDGGRDIGARARGRARALKDEL
jgi:hypothetical protein